MRRVTALILVLAVLPLSAALRQTDPQATPKFKSAVELVVLDVSVLDEKRQPVRGLSADDFTVLEDGRPQAIASFSAVDLPDVVTERTFAAPWVQTVAPDVQKNTDVKDRRIVAIVMDDATPKPVQEAPWAKAIARQVIDALSPNDRTRWPRSSRSPRRRRASSGKTTW
jgi:VWFA-related protein